MKADIYWNSHKKTFSVKHKGKVVAHCDSLIVDNPNFVVSESGRQRVLRERKKNVHAFVRGDITLKTDSNFGSCHKRFLFEDRISSDYSFAVYNPYDECGVFRVLTVIGDILVKGEFVNHIAMVYAYIHDGKPQIKVKMQ